MKKDIRDGYDIEREIIEAGKDFSSIERFVVMHRWSLLFVAVVLILILFWISKW